MKKILAISLFVLTLSSCNWFGGTPQPSNTNQGPENVTKSGTIRSKGITLDTPGTHQLVQSDGRVFFLESKILSLSDYLDQTVMIEGVMNKKNNTDVIDVATVSLSILNENTNSAAAGLLQYNGELGITFRYSSLFEISKSSADQIEISIQDQTLDLQKKDAPVIIMKVVGQVNQNLKEWIKSTMQKDSVTLVVGNRIGERLVNKENINATIYVLDDKLYEIDFLTPGGRDEQMVKNKFYELLDSLQFSGNPSSMNTNQNSPVNTNDNTATVQNNNANAAPQLNVNVNKYYSSEVPPQPTADIKTRVISYIGQNLNSFKPEDEAITTNVTPSKYEFANPNYVYVEYSDGTNKRKLLMKYYDDAGTIRVSQIGYFAPGATKDWETKTGSNDAANAAREVYDTSGAKTADINSGMRLYSSSAYKYGIQYPSNWYYSGTSASGAVHQVQFGDKPLGENPAKITVTVLKGSLSSLGLPAGKTTEGDLTVIYVEKNDRVYKISGTADLETTMFNMSQTVTVQ